MTKTELDTLSHEVFVLRCRPTNSLTVTERQEELERVMEITKMGIPPELYDEVNHRAAVIRNSK